MYVPIVEMEMVNMFLYHASFWHSLYYVGFECYSVKGFRV